jgi:hypothetical protein
MATRKSTGLDAGQLESLRTQLAEGRKPRVKVSGSQFPAGTSGSIVSIGDETVDGSDFVRVKVKVNGAMDELAFAPSELVSSVRGVPVAAEPVQVVVARPKPRQRTAKTEPTTVRRKAGPAPKVTLSISSNGAAWSVTGTRGARQVSKNVPIAPGVVTAIAKLLNQPAIVDAVGEVNDTARAEAEQRAAALRAELSQLEAVLATHRAPR